MMLPVVLLGTALSIHSASTRCENTQYKQTDAVQNASGVRVVLRMHTDDDHTKQLHWCASEYELLIMRSGGIAIKTGWNNGNEAEWERPIDFRVEGFSDDDQRAVTLVREGGRDPMVEVLVFGLGERTAGSDADYTLSSRFLRSLGMACVASLEVKGLTKDGQVVIATNPEAGCNGQMTWKISSQRNARGANLATRLPAGVAVIPLKSCVDVDQVGH
jgi:hypothetical protein